MHILVLALLTLNPKLLSAEAGDARFEQCPNALTSRARKLECWHYKAQPGTRVRAAVKASFSAVEAKYVTQLDEVRGEAAALRSRLAAEHSRSVTTKRVASPAAELELAPGTPPPSMVDP